MKYQNVLTALASGVSALLLAGCANLPDSVSELAVRDLFGDRGQQVFARDYVMCADLVESRRSLLLGCLMSRGWALDSAP